MSIHLITPWMLFAACMMAGLLGLMILMLPPRSVARVSFAFGMILLATGSALGFLSTQTSNPPAVATFQGLRIVLIATLTPVWLLFSLRYARGTQPRLSPGWKSAVLLAFAVPLGAFLIPGELIRVSSVSPQHDVAMELGGKALYLHFFTLLVAIAALANLEQTFRAMAGLMRWRSKFLILGLGIVLLYQVYSSGWAVIHQQWMFTHDFVQSMVLLAAGVLMIWSLARMGLSEGVLYPSKKIILTAATTSLVLIYLILVAGVALAVSRQMEERSFPLPALIVMAGLLPLGVLLVSDRFRQNSILLLSRHFSRPSYDYKALWQRFTERVAPAVDEAEYCRLSVDLISKTLDALSVTIWQLDAHGNLGFGGSTLLTAESAEQVMSEHALPDTLIDSLQDQQGVIDLDDPAGFWADARSRLFSSQFQEQGGHRLCVPLRAGAVVGLLLVGDRVSARPYTVEELDLLHTLGGEVGRGLMNLRNARHLAASRELQAFQTMSAFVVHDLKNTAATLSLTLQNFQNHFDNPAFRDDALRSVSGCVSHINDVIMTLGVLRQELEIKPLESDLNSVVRETLADLGGEQALPVRCKLQATPPLLLDRVQIKKVLTNLLLNARDAIGADGTVEVSTALHNSRQVELTVRDNGCGMDPDYVRAKLFKPFNSTKKKGLGIGLFQARMILEAHHGGIEVESTSGVGSVFRVLLPLSVKSE